MGCMIWEGCTVSGAWSHWLASFEALVKERGLLSEEEIRERTAEFLAKDEHHH